MPENFGARLRHRREEQGISLVTIADQTKIKLSLLDGLERDNVSHWPSGIFRRAYIRAYAQAIGLNPDVVVAEFLEAHPEPNEQFEAALAQALATGVRANGAPPTRLRNIVGSALDSLARLRRGPSADEVAGPETPRADLHARAQHPAVSVHVIEEFAPIDRTLEMADDAVLIDAAPIEECIADHAPDQTAQTMSSALVAEAPVTQAAPAGPDVMAIAELCTAFGQVESADSADSLLQEAAYLLKAVGLIVWIWDASADGLRPALAYGYSDRVLAQLPTVRRDADNATAAAFRSVQTCAISGSDHDNGALVVPVLIPEGCTGVLALELQHGGEQKEEIRAVATILAALVAQLIGRSYTAEVRVQTEIALDEPEHSARGAVQAGLAR